MNFRVYILLILYFLGTGSFAQDRTIMVSDSLSMGDTLYVQEELPVANDTIDLGISPRKALMYSAILPGLGQAYNRKYWKMPIVYGGFFGLGYMISYYNEQHTFFKTELFSILNDPGYVSPYGLSESQLRSIVDQARRERDYMMILTGIFYFLQMADAHIDAHLYEFDLNPELQVNLEPAFEKGPGAGVIGIGLALKF